MLSPMWFTLTIFATACWALANVTDSLIVKNKEKNPFVIIWIHGWLILLVLAVAYFLLPINSVHAVPIMIFSFIACGGSYMYYRVLNRLDVSVLNASWAILAIFVSIGGFYLFDESWSLLQWVAAALVIGGVFFMSYWHKHVSVLWTLFLLASVQAFYIPTIFMQKYALLYGSDYVSVTYWTLLSRAGGYCLLVLLIPGIFKQVTARVKSLNLTWVMIIILSLIFFLGGMTLGIAAYEYGPVSLIMVVGNIQPFFVIFFAWMLTKLVPSKAPKELLTRQSVQIKLISFIIVFFGLALLALT